MPSDHLRELPGFRKKSFALPFNNGMIWFEHLDGLYDNTSLILEKLSIDQTLFSRPSMPAIIGFVIHETVLNRDVASAIADALLWTNKAFRRVCFIGADKKTQRALRVALTKRSFSLASLNDFEWAKEWLIPGKMEKTKIDGAHGICAQ